MAPAPVAPVAVSRVVRRAAAARGEGGQPFDLAPLDAAAVQAPVRRPEPQQNVPRHEHVLVRRPVVSLGLPQKPAVLVQNLENTAGLDRRRARLRTRSVGVRPGMTMRGRVTRLAVPGMPLTLGRSLPRAVGTRAASVSIGPTVPPVPAMTAIAAGVRGISVVSAVLGAVALVTGLARGGTLFGRSSARGVRTRGRSMRALIVSV